MTDAERIAEFEAALEASRAETRSAFTNRALIYAAIYDELSWEIGDERATDIMKRAIHARGHEVGKKYRPAVRRGDLDEVARIFCEGSPCAGALFTPGVEERSDGRLVLRMESCPLKDAWVAENRSPEQIDHLCEIAAAVDEGTFESAGLELTFLERLGQEGASRCVLELIHREGTD
ncbi:MAG: L-2-amino-thiazoline-4-carboxylic acid hydrolase [Coriobacteriia bacterium]|nr:L-2-amino-thiazoline-4-carboxylic acid hydrolase [Coriobacteriia bacterium]